MSKHNMEGHLLIPSHPPSVIPVSQQALLSPSWQRGAWTALPSPRSPGAQGEPGQGVTAGGSFSGQDFTLCVSNTLGLQGHTLPTNNAALLKLKVNQSNNQSP